MPTNTSFETYYKQWRNQARVYSLESILESVMQECLRKTNNNHEELQKYPWQLLLIVKWICQDKMMSNVCKPDITTEQFENLRKKLWNISDKASVISMKDTSINLLIRRVFNPQKGFQQPLDASFVREASLISQSQSLTNTFINKVGISPDDFYDLAFTTVSILNTNKAAFIDESSYLKTFNNNYSAGTVQLFLKSISKNQSSLLTYFQSRPDTIKKVASECFEFPILISAPLYEKNGLYRCWNEQVLYRALESFIHTTLSGEKGAYIEKFSRIFESHVLAEAKKLNELVYDEKQIMPWCGNQAGTPSPDGLISYNDCNIFIEVKAGLYPETTMTIGNSQILAHKTKDLKKACNQAWSASTKLRELSSAPTQVISATKDYLLVVLNKDLGISKGEVLNEMYTEDKLRLLAPDALEKLPLSRIYFLSIDEYEWLIVAAQNQELHIPTFLGLCVQADEKPETSVYSFHQHLIREQVPKGISERVKKTYKDCTKRVLNMHKDSNRNPIQTT